MLVIAGILLEIYLKMFFKYNFTWRSILSMFKIMTTYIHEKEMKLNLWIVFNLLMQILVIRCEYQHIQEIKQNFTTFILIYELLMLNLLWGFRQSQSSRPQGDIYQEKLHQNPFTDTWLSVVPFQSRVEILIIVHIIKCLHAKRT